MLQVGSHIYFANTVKQQCTQHDAKHVFFEVSWRVVNTKARMKRVHRFLQFYVWELLACGVCELRDQWIGSDSTGFSPELSDFAGLKLLGHVLENHQGTSPEQLLASCAACESHANPIGPMILTHVNLISGGINGAVQAARMTLGGDRAAGMVYFAVYGFAFLGAAGQCLGVNLSRTCDAGTILQLRNQCTIEMFKSKSGAGRRDSDQTCRKRFTFSPFHVRQCFLHFDLGAVHAGGHWRPSWFAWKVESFAFI